MAILVSEYLVQAKKELNVKIFASDTDREAIDIASRGLYSKAIENDVAGHLLEKYFVPQGAGYMVNQHLRKMVIFAHHDVVKDPPYSRMDLVSCRNMLIYMNQALQKKTLYTLHFALNPGGILFLGSSENPGDLMPALQEISKKWKIYRSIQPARPAMTESFSASKISLPQSNHLTAHPRPNRTPLNGKIYEIFSEVIAEETGYAGIYINENYEVMHAVGNYRHFLQLPDRKLNFSLIKMVPDALAVPLGVAIRKAAKTGSKITTRRVKVRLRNRTRQVNFVVKPFLTGEEHDSKFLFILLCEDKSREHQQEIAQSDMIPPDLELFSELEQELKETKEHLHAAIEELETSNEELQSSNEELLSSNEELQSTNEELQSLNEELHTVNTEHQIKIKELIQLNDDLNNYFRSTDIGQIFIDQHLIIRKYTPAVLRIINLIEADIGRSISHFSFNIKYKDLVEDIRGVIKTGQPREKEIQVEDGQYALLRILPYIRLDQSQDGAIVTFINITPLKSLNNLLNAVLNSSLNGIMALRTVREFSGKIADFEWMLLNDAAGKMLGRSKEDLTGKHLLKEMPGLAKEGLFAKYLEVLETGTPLHLEHYYEHEGMKGWFETIAVRMEDGLAITFADITYKKNAQEKVIKAYQDLKKAEENLRKFNNELEARVVERTAALSVSEERFRLLSLATNDAVWDWNMVTNRLWWNEGYKTIFGQQPENVESGIDSWYERLHPGDRERVINGIHRVINYGESQWSDEFRFRRSDLTYAYVFGRGYVLHNEYSIPSRMLGSLVDLTKLKQVQEELQQTNENLTRINNDLDNFVYAASHDLKAPIINLDGLIKKLVREIPRGNKRTEYIIELMDTTIESFKKTIQTLTDISRIQRNVYEEVEEIDLAKMLNDIELSILDMIEQAAADIQTDFREVSKILFSPKNLHSILHNLLTNAIKYRNPDVKPVIKISARKVPGYAALLCIEDNGLGIPETQRDKLFTMFKRFHDHVEVTGVGLYIVKRIIENAGGKIEVASEVGQGTMFRIYFPE